MVLSGNAARKCLTALAIELTWPGVPVTACASMRPSASNTPAERSPASRTEVENAVRIRVCACSSTTAMSRLHMIWVWICDRAALGRVSMASGSVAARQMNISEAVDPRVEEPAHDGRGLVLGDDGGAGNRRTGAE